MRACSSCTSSGSSSICCTSMAISAFNCSNAIGGSPVLLLPSNDVLRQSAQLRGLIAKDRQWCGCFSGESVGMRLCTFKPQSVNKHCPCIHRYPHISEPTSGLPISRECHRQFERQVQTCMH